MPIPQEVKQCTDFILADIKNHHDVERTFKRATDRFGGITVEGSRELLAKVLERKSKVNVISEEVF
jgi:starvation-inducible outer membrane lipoprotein